MISCRGSTGTGGAGQCTGFRAQAACGTCRAGSAATKGSRVGGRDRGRFGIPAAHAVRERFEGAGGAPVSSSDARIVVAGELVVDAHDLHLAVGRDGLQAGQDLARLREHHRAPARGRCFGEGPAVSRCAMAQHDHASTTYASTGTPENTAPGHRTLHDGFSGPNRSPQVPCRL